jgi:spermidine/putrescine transport system substrate-binding protein
MHESLWERRFDRKGFMAASAVAALAAASGGRLTSKALAAAEQSGGVLHYYNWAAYVNPKTYSDFTKATGIKVKKSFYTSNETMLAKLNAGARGYDLAVPTEYMVRILIEEDLLEKIDLKKLPNVRKNIDPKFFGLPYDPKNEWSVPKDWGTTGFVYRTDLVKERPKSWRQFYALFKKYPKRFTLLDGSLETVGSVLMMMGYSYNSDSASELDKARKFLLELKPFVHSIDSVNLKQKIIRGQAYGGMAWNGDASVIIGEKKAEYVIPAEGAEFWIDAYVIPTGAKNPDAAHKWIDFCYQPRVNAQETSFTYYGSPLKRSLLRGPLAKSIFNNTDVFPPQSLVRKLVSANVSARGTRSRERIWTEFKSA